MLFNYYQDITQSSQIREKFHKFLNWDSEVPFNFSFNEVRIFFLLKNTFQNRTLFLAFLIVLEKITDSNFRFISAKNTIVGFNLRKDIVFGACYTLRHFKKSQFLNFFIDYSLKKINKYVVFCSEKNNNYYLQFMNNSIQFGFKKLLSNAPFVLNDLDYDFLAPLFEQSSYGVYFHFHSHYRYYLINRLIFSHYGISIF